MAIAFLRILEPSIVAQAANYAAFEKDWPVTLPEKGNIVGPVGSNDLFYGLSRSQKLRAYQEWLGIQTGACGIACGV